MNIDRTSTWHSHKTAPAYQIEPYRVLTCVNGALSQRKEAVVHRGHGTLNNNHISQRRSTLSCHHSNGTSFCCVGTEEQTGVEALPAPTDAPAAAAAASDAAASEAAADVAAASATPVTVALLASEVSDAEDAEGSPAHGDDSSVDYAADLNESPDDDEATLEEEEVCRP